MKRTLGIVLVAAFLIGCGEEGDTTTIIEESDGGQRVESSSSSLTVPDLEGERLDIAEDDLEDMGLEWEELGGGTFGVVDVTAWEVCETEPEAGSNVDEGDEIELVVDRPGNC